MIELPEIETIRRDLDREITGKRIKEVSIEVARPIGSAASRTKLLQALNKAKVEVVSRFGTLIWVELDSGFTVTFDLGTGGQLLRVPNKTKLDKRTAVVIKFTQYGQLLLVDGEGDASVGLHKTEVFADECSEHVGSGIDPIEEPMSWTTFGRMLHAHHAKLRTLLMDDSFLLGIGPMYADEILFHAGLRYDRVSNSLTSQEIRRLYRSLVETLFEAVKYRGSTVEGSSYVDVFGEAGGYQEHHCVFRKDGELSPRSRRPIVRSKFSGQWTYYCEQSQV